MTDSRVHREMIRAEFLSVKDSNFRDFFNLRKLETSKSQLDLSLELLHSFDFRVPILKGIYSPLILRVMSIVWP